MSNVEAGYDAIDDKLTAVILNDHGTSVAGVIAATVNNNEGVAGIAPNCKIVPISVRLNNANFWADATRAFDFALAEGIDIINCSWNAPIGLDCLDDAIYRAHDNGRGGKECIITVSTGNESASNIGYPANLSTCIAVGATNAMGMRWESSNYGHLDITAPGTSIYTPRICFSEPHWSYEYAYLYGTSMSAPIVAGVAALVLSVNPNLSNEEVKKILCSTATRNSNYTFSYNDRHNLSPWNQEIGYGIVNAKRAVLETLPADTHVSGTHSGPITGFKIDVKDATFSSNSTLTAGQSIVLTSNVILESGADFTMQLDPTITHQ